MRKWLIPILCLLLILAMVVPFAGCKKNTEVTEMTYPGQDNMTFEELQELDRQNPITIEITTDDFHVGTSHSSSA